MISTSNNPVSSQIASHPDGIPNDRDENVRAAFLSAESNYSPLNPRSTADSSFLVKNYRTVEIHRNHLRNCEVDFNSERS